VALAEELRELKRSVRMTKLQEAEAEVLAHKLETDRLRRLAHSAVAKMSKAQVRERERVCV
jgi:hypothetical protein